MATGYAMFIAAGLFGVIVAIIITAITPPLLVTLPLVIIAIIAIDIVITLLALMVTLVTLLNIIFITIGCLLFVYYYCQAILILLHVTLRYDTAIIDAITPLMLPSIATLRHYGYWYVINITPLSIVGWLHGYEKIRWLLRHWLRLLILRHCLCYIIVGALRHYQLIVDIITLADTCHCHYCFDCMPPLIIIATCHYIIIGHRHFVSFQPILAYRLFQYFIAITIRHYCHHYVSLRHYAIFHLLLTLLLFHYHYHFFITPLFSIRHYYAD